MCVTLTSSQILDRQSQQKEGWIYKYSRTLYSVLPLVYNIIYFLSVKEKKYSLVVFSMLYIIIIIIIKYTIYVKMKWLRKFVCLLHSCLNMSLSLALHAFTRLLALPSLDDLFIRRIMLKIFCRTQVLYSLDVLCVWVTQRCRTFLRLVTNHRHTHIVVVCTAENAPDALRSTHQTYKFCCLSLTLYLCLCAITISIQQVDCHCIIPSYVVVLWR